MYKFLLSLTSVLLLSCASTTYFVMRHAEKESSTMVSDPPLTEEGTKQALDLKLFLQQKKIKLIYSTNYVRTLSTAEPTRQFYGLETKLYDPKTIPAFVGDLKKIKGGAVLIIGHSNTVDDVVNGLMSSAVMTDLDDKEYGDIWIVTQQRNNTRYQKIKLPRQAAQ